MPKFCACSYLGCDSRYPKDSHALSFHNIPANEEQRTAWIAAIGRKEWNPTKYSVVCSKHFDVDDYHQGHNQTLNLKVKLRPILRKGAIPKKHIITECSNKHISNAALEPSMLPIVSAKRKRRQGNRLQLAKNAKRKSITTQIHNVQENTSNTFSAASTTINTANPVHDNTIMALEEEWLVATVPSTEEYSKNEGDLDQAVKPSLTNPTKFLEPTTQLPEWSTADVCSTKAQSKCGVQIRTYLGNLTSSGCQTDVAQMLDRATQTCKFTTIQCSTPCRSYIEFNSNCDEINVTLDPTTYSPSIMEHSVYGYNMMSRRRITKMDDLEVLLMNIPSDIETPDEDSGSSDNEFVAESGPSQNKKRSSPRRKEFDKAIQEDSTSESEEEMEPKVTLMRKFQKREAVTTIPVFTLQKGAVQQYFANGNTATDTFLSLISGKVIVDLIFQSNLFMQQHERKIKSITQEEMYGFLGLEFLFGYHRLPQRHLYWKSDPDLSIPIVSETMTRTRYEQILSNLHVNDNKALPIDNKDKLYKLRPLITRLNENFQLARLPDQYQSIGESMVLFKGRSSIKQYNPMKPIKRGYKLWCRADMSGYIYEFDVYQGKKEDETLKERFGLGGSIVEKMTSSLKNNNFVIMMDNYFSSIDLFEYLKSEGILACGTVRANRKGIPKIVADKSLKRGNFDYRISEQGISYFKWKDNRCINFLSNYHGSETTNVSRTQKDGSKLQVTAPVVVKDYNAHMGGVDKADKLRSLYDRDTKSKKWWHRLFFAMMEITLVNSYVIHCEMHGQMSVLDFKRSVTNGLLAKSKSIEKKGGKPRQEENAACSSVKRRRGFSVSNDIRLQNRGGHWPEFVSQRGRCEWCSINQIQSKPHSRCTLCKVFLCINEKKNCFLQYHQ